MTDLRTERPKTQRTRRLAGAAGVVATAGVVAVVWALGPGSDSSGTAQSPSAGPLTAERAAADYVDAYASFDRTRLRSLLADDASGFWLALRDYNRADEAIEFRILPGACSVAGEEVDGTLVSCAFDVHALGSEQLGRGPYTDNQFLVLVRDGKVVESEIDFAYDSNGFAGQMWEPFVAWVTKHYPQDVPRMLDGGDARPDATSISLWHRHIAEYVAARS